MELEEKGENEQMVGSDYNTWKVNRVMRKMTNELAVTYARTRGAMMSLPLQNAKTLGASRVELG